MGEPPPVPTAAGAPASGFAVFAGLYGYGAGAFEPVR